VDIDLAIYFGLFWNAFIAATLLPALSEITLASLIAAGAGAPIALFIAATFGNVAGSALNWWLGNRLATFKDKKWFPFSDMAIAQASELFNRYGKWSLLFAWLPVIGDPLTLVAGVLKIRFLPFLFLVTLGKAARYGIIVMTFNSASP